MMKRMRPSLVLISLNHFLLIRFHFLHCKFQLWHCLFRNSLVETFFRLEPLPLVSVKVGDADPPARRPIRGLHPLPAISVKVRISCPQGMV